MPGKFCNGKPTEQPFVKESQAYCEGMAYRAGGTAVQRPVTDDPYGNDRPVESAAWIRGWSAAEAVAQGSGTITGADAGCCGLRGLSVAA